MILKTNIKVRVETHYGRETIYPVCEKARSFAGIAGTVTLTPKVLRLIKDLGYEIEVEAPKITVIEGE